MTMNRVQPFHTISSQSYDGLRKTLRWLFMNHAHEVHTDTWQGTDISKRPEMKSYELLNVTTNVWLGNMSLGYWAEDIKPNLPWANNHFLERVCGAPINPGIEWANWPWGDSAKKFIEEGGQFNHNYMERYWPKFAGMTGPTRNAAEFEEVHDNGELIAPQTGCCTESAHFGIRGEYGDLDDLVELLVKDPFTRQAWLPIFFPEDTGDANPGRKPCTLGYQFIRRGDHMHIYYPLRSCDFIRHWPDDVYLTIRLLLWVLRQCRDRDPGVWGTVVPGNMTMQMTSLHIFENDYRNLEKEYENA